MDTTFAIIAVVIMFIILVRLISKRSSETDRSRRPGQRQTKTAAATSQNTQWRAVKIKPCLISCSAVQKLGYKKFLASECPTLPLSNCSQNECDCKYIHLDDRRDGGDRRMELGELGKFLPVNLTERRNMAGRRVTDLAA